MAARRKAASKRARPARKRTTRRKTARKRTRKKAARKKSARRKPARKKASRRKTARKKAARRKPARKKTARKKTSRRKPARKKTAGRKKASKKAADGGVDAVARRIVKFATNRGKLTLADLYAPNATSEEPGGAPPTQGLQALQEKLRTWEGALSRESWKTRSVLVKGNAVAIEWDVRVVTRGRKTVEWSEVAIHQIRGGKIVAERYYYDPQLLAPIMAEFAGAGAPSGAGTPAARPAAPAARPPVPARPMTASRPAVPRPPISSPMPRPAGPAGSSPVRASPLDPDAAKDKDEEDEDDKVDPLDL